MLDLWGMRSTLSLPSLLGPLWPGLVALDRVLSMGQIGLNCNYDKLNHLKLTGFPFNCVYSTLNDPKRFDMKQPTDQPTTITINRNHKISFKKFFHLFNFILLSTGCVVDGQICKWKRGKTNFNSVDDCVYEKKTFVCQWISPLGWMWGNQNITIAFKQIQQNMSINQIYRLLYHRLSQIFLDVCH